MQPEAMRQLLTCERCLPNVAQQQHRQHVRCGAAGQRHIQSELDRNHHGQHRAEHAGRGVHRPRPFHGAMLRRSHSPAAVRATRRAVRWGMACPSQDRAESAAAALINSFIDERQADQRSQQVRQSKHVDQQAATMNAMADATRVGSLNQRRESRLPSPLESSIRKITTVSAYVGFPRNNTKRWMNAISTRMYPRPMAMKYSRRTLRPDRACGESASGTTRKCDHGSDRDDQHQPQDGDAQIHLPIDAALVQSAKYLLRLQREEEERRVVGHRRNVVARSAPKRRARPGCESTRQTPDAPSPDWSAVAGR